MTQMVSGAGPVLQAQTARCVIRFLIPAAAPDGQKVGL